MSIQTLITLLGGQCQQCGSKDKLNIHHKDRNHENGDVSNVVVLCRSCHMKTHRESRPNRRLKGDITMIEVTKGTALRLKRRAEYGETYEEVVVRLLGEHEKAKKP